MTASTKYNLACNLALTGRRSEALAMLHDAVDHGLDVNSLRAIPADSDFKSLHGDPRFDEIIVDAEQRASPAPPPQ